MARKRDPGLDVEAWQRKTPAVAEGARVSLRGLPPLVAAEVLYGLQERARADVKTDPGLLPPYCDLLRREGAASIADVASDREAPVPGPAGGAFLRSARRLEMNPETERHKDVWDLFVFGHGGRLTFTGISQPWLREAVKRWAFDDLPRRRGDGVSSMVQRKVHSIGRLSESLRLQRADHGDVIGALGREDITAFCTRMAFLAGQGQISEPPGSALPCARLVLGLPDDEPDPRGPAAPRPAGRLHPPRGRHPGRAGRRGHRARTCQPK